MLQPARGSVAPDLIDSPTIRYGTRFGTGPQVHFRLSATLVRPMISYNINVSNKLVGSPYVTPDGPSNLPQKRDYRDSLFAVVV